MFGVASFVVLAIASSVLAQPSPLTPATANEGSNCVISWTADSTGKWTQTNIELMTGSNQNMVHLTTVTTVDTTSSAPTSFTWTCPDVTINAPIYWYQFSTAVDPTDLLWTTRFAIAGAAGELVAAPNQFQPDVTNSPIPWGLGALTDPSTAKPAPSYITGETSSTGASGNSTNPSGSVVMSSPTGAVVLPTSSGVNPIVMTSPHMTTSVMVSATTASAAASPTSTNGAVSSQGSYIVALGAVAFAMFALA